MNLFFDIETVPTQRPEVLQTIHKEVRSEVESRAETIRRQYKKPETIDAHLRDLQAGVATTTDEAVRRTALDGGFGEILCIGWAFNDAPVKTRCRRLDDPEPDLIRTFLQQLPPATTAAPRWIGHNIIGFDLRFLWQRCLVHGIQPPGRLPLEGRDSLAFDTMTEWAGTYNRDRWPSLDRLCRIFGLPSPKAKHDGSQVWDMAKAGRYEEIETYCRADVEAARLLFHAMNPSDAPSVETLSA